MKPQQKIICSACLMGVKCRYDGKSKANKKVLALVKKVILIPVCPEQLGGQTTPRKDAEQKGNRVIEKSGKDVTKYFLAGAKEVLRMAKILGIKKAILKQRSPSCGCGQIYDGTFSGKIIKGNGVTTKLLKKHNIKVFSEYEYH